MNVDMGPQLFYTALCCCYSWCCTCRAMFLTMDGTLMRGDDTRRLQLCDLFWHPVRQVRPHQAFAPGAVTDQGKTNRVSSSLQSATACKGSCCVVHVRGSELYSKLLSAVGLVTTLGSSLHICSYSEPVALAILACGDQSS